MGAFSLHTPMVDYVCLAIFRPGVKTRGVQLNKREMTRLLLEWLLVAISSDAPQRT